MRLDEIAALLRTTEVRGLGVGADATEVTDLAYDSRRTSAGSLFFCLPGAVDDGHRHAEKAVAAGAVALVSERFLPLDVPQLIAPGPGGARAAMNLLAAPFFGHPSRSLVLAGVTGTNGKTTTTYMLDAIFATAGYTRGLIGTVEVRLPGASVAGRLTTPESIDLQRLLRRMLDAGVGFCAMEVTSIGLAKGRVEGTGFAAAIFTNLTQDHLDYHGDLDSYYQSKRALFQPGRAARALVNTDDPYGARLAAELAHQGGDMAHTGAPPCLAFALEAPADVRAVDVTASGSGSSFRLVGDAGHGVLDQPVHLRLPGRFNVSNALGAAAAAAALGLPADAISGGLDSLPPVPGRFELVDEGQDFTVVVDYAHTPDGLERALTAARDLLNPLAHGAGQPRVIAVFGCGGDRDRGKRPLMGRAAAGAADLVYVTSDNPRGEAPEAIIDEIELGVAAAPPRLGYRLIPDREEAIATAIAQAEPGDVVVIAGKGHETTQTLRDRKIDFDDRLVAASALRGRNGADPRLRAP